jgi:hypothetical protein
MSILERLNPLRVIRAADSVSRLQDLGHKLRVDQKEMARQLRAISRQLEQLDQTFSRQLEQLDHTLKRQEDVIASVPALHTEVQQCLTSYKTDARHADRLPALRASLGDGDRLAAHAAAAVARTPLQLDPFPHAVIENLLPEDAAEELLGALPSSVFFKRNAMRHQLQVPFVFAPAYSRLVWGIFFEKVVTETLLPALTEKFRPALDDFVRTHWPGLRSMAEGGIELRVANSRLMLRRPGYVIKPHRDPRWAFLTCLVYLPGPKDVESYGTQIYRLRNEPTVTHSSPLWVDPSECELVKDVPAERNTALVFLNSTGAHGASIPSDAPSDTERYLYQVHFSVEGNMRQKLIETLEGAARSSWVSERGTEY